MDSLANYRSWPLRAALALAAACGTEEFQLEPMYAALSIDDPVVATWDGGATCVTVEALVGHGRYVLGRDPPGAAPDEVRYEVRLNGRPIHSNDLERVWDKAEVRGGSYSSFCVPSGEYDLSLHKRGKSVAHTGIISMRPHAQMTILVYGDADAPNLKAAEVDLSPPGVGLQRLRITNLISDGQPVQLIYYDEQGEELARSEIVAYGDTWTGTISKAITYWAFYPRLDDAPPFHNDPVPLDSFPDSSSIYRFCIERAFGIVVTDRPEVGIYYTFGPARAEYYGHPPPVCTIDPEICPSCDNVDHISLGWPYSCSTRADGARVCTAIGTK